MAKLDKILQKQLPAGLTIVKPGETPQEFAVKLNELQREIQQLQWACTRLQRVNRTEASRYMAGTDIRIVSEPLIQELAALQGWLVSAVESYFGLVWNEMGWGELQDVQRAWRKL